MKIKITKKSGGRGNEERRRSGNRKNGKIVQLRREDIERKCSVMRRLFKLRRREGKRETKDK